MSEETRQALEVSMMFLKPFTNKLLTSVAVPSSTAMTSRI